MRQRRLRSGLAMCALSMLFAPIAADARSSRSPQWVRCNTHTHTAAFERSDADTPPLEVARWYKAHGYQCLVITDHEHLTDIVPLNAALADERFLVLPGQEITQLVKDSAHPAGRRHGHVNGIGSTARILPVGFPESWRWPEKWPVGPWEGTMREAFQLNVARIRAQGALAQINHPSADDSVLAEHLEGLDGPLLMEIYDHQGEAPAGLNASGRKVGRSEALWDQMLTHGTTIWGVASDDAHKFQGDGAQSSGPGRGWIVLRVNQLHEKAVMAALREGNFYASNGMRLKRYSVTRTGIHIDIDASAGGSASGFRTEFIGSGGELLATVEGRRPRYRFRGGERYVRAVVVSPDGRMAWTQPVFR